MRLQERLKLLKILLTLDSDAVMGQSTQMCTLIVMLLQAVEATGKSLM